MVELPDEGERLAPPPAPPGGASTPAVQPLDFYRHGNDFIMGRALQAEVMGRLISSWMTTDEGNKYFENAKQGVKERQDLKDARAQEWEDRYSSASASTPGMTERVLSRA